MRYVCIHGHFYQPPRENPWLEAIDLQESAHPYHDWNERVTAECYARNAAARILDSEKLIARIVNNYSTMSFDFGPTLLSWLEACAPRTYGAILAADKLGKDKFAGHGPALAQGYNHIILPLANRRDKVTQVRWGLADFRHRFGRQAEGIWLPETAVDTETLEVLADHGMKFTILAPRQASRVRRFGSHSWKDVSDGRIDPSRAYLVRLPSRKRIAVFFYDAPISHAVAFEGLLNDGRQFAERLLTGFSESRKWPQLCHIATDGESYGHHHRLGEMALASGLDSIQASNLAQLTVYSQFLERHPPDHTVEIFENSSWSCVHGVERWRSDCGCNSLQHPGWNQAWREPLREAFDWLRDNLAPLYETKASVLLKDPWKARDDYIEIVLDRSPENVQRFLADHATHALGPEETTTALKLLEMQRHALLMYTSCGWFFDDLAGLETVQVMEYASRAAQLGQETGGGNLEAELLMRLGKASSNLPDHPDGERVYEKMIRPVMFGMREIAAQYALDALFEPDGNRARIYCNSAQRDAFHLEVRGHTRLATGRAQFRSEITREAAEFSFAALHVGADDLVCGVSAALPSRNDDHAAEQLADTFQRDDPAEVLRLLQERFENVYSWVSLSRDEQRRILRSILNAADPARTLESATQRWIEEATEAFASHSSDLNVLEHLRRRLELARSLPSPPVLWEVENIAFAPLVESHEHWRSEAATGNPQAQAWLNALAAVGTMLCIRLKGPDAAHAKSA